MSRQAVNEGPGDNDHRHKQERRQEPLVIAPFRFLSVRHGPALVGPLETKRMHRGGVPVPFAGKKARLARVLPGAPEVTREAEEDGG